MTELQLKTDLANITDAELIEQAKNMICNLAETSGKSLQMSVPPNKRDTDMLLMELVNRYDNVVNNLLISGVVVPKGTLCGKQCDNLQTACPKCYAEYLEYKKNPNYGK